MGGIDGFDGHSKVYYLILSCEAGWKKSIDSEAERRRWMQRHTFSTREKAEQARKILYGEVISAGEQEVVRRIVSEEESYLYMDGYDSKKKRIIYEEAPRRLSPPYLFGTAIEEDVEAL